MLGSETGELQERRLKHREKAEQFYRAVATLVTEVRMGMEASGHAAWFERLLAELNFELWVGYAAGIRAKRLGKLHCKKRLCRESGRQQLESLPLALWPTRRQHDQLKVLDRINPTIADLTRAIDQQVEKLSRGAAHDDSSWGGCADSDCFRAHHRASRPLQLRQAGSPAISVWSRRKIPAESDAD